MLSLLHDYIKVSDKDSYSYGGNQMKMPWTNINKCGCGVIAAADTLIYLRRWHFNLPVTELDDFCSSTVISEESYRQLVRRLNTRYFPLIPNSGSNGLMLMLGMNAFFISKALPFRAQWQFSGRYLWCNIRSMLSEDIPVILSVGPNFPYIWQDNKTVLYIRRGDSFLPASSAKAHYVVVTGIDNEWLRVASWGKMFYIKRSEFEDYSKKHSQAFLCNILLIRHM